MYAKDIDKAAMALVGKAAPDQKVMQWRRDGRKAFYITPAKIRQLRRLCKYQLAATSGKMGGWL